MKISIFGLGYVGCVSIGCLAKKGNIITGVDINEKKVELIKNSKSTITETGLDELIEEGVNKGLISATVNVEEAIRDSQIAIICVGTPNLENGTLDMSYIYDVCKEIGKILKNKKDFLTISIRSTVMPGTIDNIIKIIEKDSGKIHSKDFAVVLNPEFLREGSAVKDFFAPPFTIVASDSVKGIEEISKLFGFLKSEILIVDISTAELIKLLNNSFHALKVAFANEIGRLSKALKIDSHKLMDIFIKDTQLNISSAYLKPGFSFGGSCLPKDLKALKSFAIKNSLELPIINSIDNSNTIHTEFVLNKIISFNKSRIGLYGLSFKKGTDDLRFSPSLNVAEKLINRGLTINIYDKYVNTSKLIGKNKDHLFNHFPHINNVLTNTVHEIISGNEIVVLTQIVDSKDIDIIKKSNCIILDLAKNKELENSSNYEGICW